MIETWGEGNSNLHYMIQGPCTKCKRECSVDTNNKNSFVPGTSDIICTKCYDKEYSPQAIRDKKLEQIFKIARLANKKWWQFWK